MIRTFIVAGAIALLTACSTAPTVITTPVIAENVPLSIPSVRPAEQTTSIQWFVITAANVDDVLRRAGSDVLFAMIPDDYKALAINEAELRRYIEEQNDVIAAYRKYYEDDKRQAPRSMQTSVPTGGDGNSSWVVRIWKFLW